jgi:hypothetical protein
LWFGFRQFDLGTQQINIAGGQNIVKGPYLHPFNGVLQEIRGGHQYNVGERTGLADGAQHFQTFLAHPAQPEKDDAEGLFPEHAQNVVQILACIDRKIALAEMVDQVVPKELVGFDDEQGHWVSIDRIAAMGGSGTVCSKKHMPMEIIIDMFGPCRGLASV